MSDIVGVTVSNDKSSEPEKSIGTQSKPASEQKDNTVSSETGDIAPKANTDNEEKMKGIYLEKKEIKENEEIKNMKFFIGSLDEKALVEIDAITAISESAFANSDVENILFSGCSSGCYTIGKSAFEDCDKLKTVIFGKLGRKKEIETSLLKNVVPASAAGNFTIQTNAFKGCSSLTTLVLPKISGMLTIEKDAFSGCEKLRTVVADCGNADFTGNPFSGCPAHLTFVCKKNFDKKKPNKKDSKVARFARENGYRSVYVD